jgi:hypothetical protein
VTERCRLWFQGRCNYGKAVFTDRGRPVPSTPNSGFIGTVFMSVLRTVTASNACALSVLSVRVAEELSVFCPKTGFPTLP